MDYLCAKFGDFSFSRFGFIMQTDIQTDRIKHRQNHIITDAAKRLSHASVVSVSNKFLKPTRL